MQIAVVGAGYVGLVTGANLADIGHEVTFVEIDPERRAELETGSMPIEEPGLAETFAANRDRITITGALAEAIPVSELVLIAVGTPIGETGESDLTQLRSALDTLREWPDVHVSVRSTLPPGTSVRLPSMLGRESGERVSTNPEFLRQGSAMTDYRNPTRIVIGTFAETSAEHLGLIHELFAGLDGPRLEVDVAAAELIKNVANGFLALKLSFVNEVAALAEEYGVEVQQVLDGIAFDPRIGSTYMRPGLGFGGSCLPKELQVLAAAGRQRGIPMHMARAVSQVNLEQQDRFVRRILAELPPSNARVALLGLSFKAHTDDLRGSPALHVARRLLDAGHQVVAHDPAVRPERARAAAPGIQMVETAIEACRGADAVIIGTEWPEYLTLDLADVRAETRSALLFDGRNIIDPAAAASAGFAYRGIGRRPLEASDVSIGASAPELREPAAKQQPLPAGDGGVTAGRPMVTPRE
jgi:UDPglucose 6-dehydrogenase